MTKLATLSLGTLAAGVVFALTPLVHAQGTPPAPTPPPAVSDHGKMGGDMKGMMNMMGQMSQMMENCNRMMQQKEDGLPGNNPKKDREG